MRYHGPTATSCQLSWEHIHDNSYWLTVIAKQTYAVGPHGRLRFAAEQQPLRTITGDVARDGCVEHDADVYPYKPLTDVIVQGHAYPTRPNQSSFIAEVHAGAASKSLLIIGERQARLSRIGAIMYSVPAPIEKIPLTYDRAYGGIDLEAEERYGNPMMAFDKYRRAELQPEYHSPFIYPRNAAGRGYLLEKTSRAVERLALPNIEDPSDPISKRDIVVKHVKHWPQMPLPWGTNWLHPAFFPRVAYLGASRQFEPFEGPWPEVRRGFAPAGWPRLGDIESTMDYRFFNGGSLGLQLPAVTEGGLELRLRGLHRSGAELSFGLPARPPRIWVDGRNNALKETRPALHHVVIRPDDGEVDVVWRGQARALRIYTAEELATMPYQIDWA